MGQAQEGQYWHAYDYLSDRTIGIYSDIEKLSQLRADDTYLLALATKNPGDLDWARGIDQFNSKYAPLTIKSITKPSDFPPSYFVGTLEIIKSKLAHTK